MLAQTLARVLSNPTVDRKVVQSLEVPVDTWEKLEQLAVEAARSAARPVSASEVAAAILQQFVNGSR